MFLFQPESRRFAVSWKPLFPLGHCFIYFLEELQGNIWLVITRYENFNSVDVTWDCRWHLLLLNICNQYLFLYVCFMLVICCACVLYLLLFSTTQIYIVRKRNFKCFFFERIFYLMANILHNSSLRMRSQSFCMSCNLSCAVLCFGCCCGCKWMLVYVTSSLWSCWPFPLSGRWESDLPHCLVNVRLQSAVRSIQL